MVIVGKPDAIYIPELGGARRGEGRLRGLRLMHTHLRRAEELSQEDLMDMLFLRLDSLAVLTVDPNGEPGLFQYAHLVPGAAETAEPDDAPPYRTHPAVPWDRADADLDALTQALEDEFAHTGATVAAPAKTSRGESDRAVLVSVSTRPWKQQEASLAELAELARTAGVEVADTMMQRVTKVNPRLIMGKGKLADLEVAALRTGAGLVVFDRELSPAQLRNLADLTERKVLDRTQLILDIFAQHAVSRAGKLQVEMAQLNYTLPRLVGKNRALSRLMGGIGGRGPGETKLEMDRRKVRERITRIKAELKKLRQHRASARNRRERAGVPVAALVGYTNAGKSTLLNTLTGATVLAENKLFATLDPTTRRLRFPEEHECILTDTVGFIRDLPEELKEAFRATLEELETADLLLHVADAGHSELETHLASVEEILDEMHLGEIPRLLVLNKWDQVAEENRAPLLTAYPDAIPTSALTTLGLATLSHHLTQILFGGEAR
jgi:GTP-binding protein HflX